MLKTKMQAEIKGIKFTLLKKMCIKMFQKFFVLEKTIYNIVSGILFPGTY